MDAAKMRWSNLKVGIVVLIGLIVFIFIVSIVGTEQNIFSSTYQVKFFVTNVHGLVNGAMVSLGGLKVGYVSSMEFVRQNNVEGVDITADVLTKYRPSITNSTTAQFKTIGLLGDKYIDLTIGSKTETPVPERGYIPVVESFDLEAAGPQFKTTLNEFTELLANARRITASMERGEGSIGRFLKHPGTAQETEKFLHSLNDLMAAVREKKGTLGKAVYDESMAKNIADISENMKIVTDELRKGQGSMGKLLMDDRLYNNLASFSERANTLMTRAAADTSSVSQLAGSGSFYRELISLMKDLNQLLVDLKLHPERYVKFSVF
ncbi:MAG TPA: MlaD family protein [Bacteroidota bacterium]|nr:MlaD family protein [Bacteroidota bacterium]